MDELNEYNTYISSLINQLSLSKDTFIQNHKKTKSQINAQFNNLINLINNNQEIVLKTLDTILQNNQSVIYAKSQQLQKALKTAQNTMKACDELLDNVEINKYERKKKVLAMTNNILNDKIQKDVVDISTNIFFEFNEEAISPFLSNLVDVSDEEKHPIPIIDDIQCEDITQSECTVKWNAELSAKDLKKKINSKLFMKVENINNDIDEKEKEQINSELILFNSNKKQYKYNMSGLKRD
eukprot:343606_1